MKSLSFFVLIIFSLMLLSCRGEKQIEKEKVAIIKAIEEVTNAYNARELGRIDSIYVHDEVTTRLNAGSYGYVYRKGWDEIAKVYKETFAEHPLAITNKYEKKNFIIRVYGKSAWSIHDEIIYDSENEYQYHQIGVHFLEKIKGEWKIVYLSYIDTSSYETEDEE
ncbi:MAG: hypothetical protein ABFS16_14250 [Bacteroidota bacterium]